MRRNKVKKLDANSLCNYEKSVVIVDNIQYDLEGLYGFEHYSNESKKEVFDSLMKETIVSVKTLCKWFDVESLFSVSIQDLCLRIREDIEQETGWWVSGFTLIHDIGKYEFRVETQRETLENFWTKHNGENQIDWIRNHDKDSREYWETLELFFFRTTHEMQSKTA